MARHRAALPRAIKRCLLRGRAACHFLPCAACSHVGRSRKPGTVRASPPCAGDRAGDTTGARCRQLQQPRRCPTHRGDRYGAARDGAQCPEGCWGAGWSRSCASLLHALSHSERCWEEMRAALLAAKRGCGHQPVQPPQGRNAASEAAHLYAEPNPEAGGCGPAALQAPGRRGYKAPTPTEHPPTEHPSPRMSILLMSIPQNAHPPNARRRSAAFRGRVPCAQSRDVADATRGRSRPKGDAGGTKRLRRASLLHDPHRPARCCALGAFNPEPRVNVCRPLKPLVGSASFSERPLVCRRVLIKAEGLGQPAGRKNRLRNV